MNQIVSSMVGDNTGELIYSMFECCITPQTREDIFRYLKLKKHSDTFKRYIKPIIEAGWLEMTDPGNPTNPNQKYHTTERGKILLQIISHSKDAGK